MIFRLLNISSSLGKVKRFSFLEKKNHESLLTFYCSTTFRLNKQSNQFIILKRKKRLNFQWLFLGNRQHLKATTTIAKHDIIYNSRYNNNWLVHYVSNPDYYLGIVHAQHNTIVIIMPTVKYTDVLCYK